MIRERNRFHKPTLAVTNSRTESQAVLDEWFDLSATSEIGFLSNMDGHSPGKAIAVL